MTYSGKHAECYDLFYQDKPYREEAQYVAALIRARFSAAKTVLDLGCGTGLRCLELARQGYKVSGVDQSASMLNAACRHMAIARDISPAALDFQVGDITTFLASSKYDAVIALFHVFSYLTTEVALKKAIDCSFANLNPGGVFLFDYWHGPGVMKEPPAVRTKIVETANLKATRTAIPQYLPDQRLVKLTVSLQVTDKENGVSHDSEESYSLRYWFPEELQEAVKNAGFKQIQQYAWMTQSSPGPEVWQACTIALRPFVGEGSCSLGTRHTAGSQGNSSADT
ncbi:MAG TPA: class I SAM-dependent methyltransferase [Chthoniobacterales bacterium]|nr:class I SAM-dependent methyltransferase [Chthoniobacterales bacterium]